MTRQELEEENAELKEKLLRAQQFMEDLSGDVLDLCHQLRMNLSSARSYMQLVELKGADLKASEYGEALSKALAFQEICIELVGRTLQTSVSSQNPFNVKHE